MKKIMLFFAIGISCALSLKATLRTWNGSVNSSWSVAGNWTGGVPATGASNDTIVFDGSITPVVTITDVNQTNSAASFRKLIIRNSAVVTLSSGSSTFFNFDLGVTIDVSSRLNVGAATSTRFSVQGFTASAVGDISGILDLQGTGNSSNYTDYIPGPGFVSGPVTTVSGRIIVGGPNSRITSNLSSHLVVANGAFIEFARDGGSAPVANFQNGSTLWIRGVVSVLFGFNTSAIYQGVVIWECTSQTVSGSAASLSLSSSYTFDSIVVKSTGATGTIRLSTEMSTAPAINTLRVDGGIVELASPRSANRGMSIGANLTVTGGTLYLNATDATDVFAVYNLSVNVADVSITGGTVNFSNRPLGSGATYGTGNINARSSFIQDGGLITETAPLPPISDASSITLAGVSTNLNLKLINWINQIRLRFNTASFQANLLSNIICPEFLDIAGTSTVILHGYDLVATYPYLSVNTAGPVRTVTNSTGKFKVNSVPASVSITMPVAYSSTTYNPLTIATTASATTNDYYARVENGNNPPGIFNTGSTINRTWIINSATSIVSNSVNLSFTYAASDANVGCTPAADMELGHFIGGSWNLDPNGINRTPVLAGFYSVGTFAPNGLDSAFVVGNIGSILSARSSILLQAKQQGSGYLLDWKIYGNFILYNLEISTDGRRFYALENGLAQNTKLISLPFEKTYFRIRGFDAMGGTTFSNTLFVQANPSHSFNFSVFPNPVSGNQFSVQLFADKDTQAELRILDYTGKLVYKQQLKLLAGYSTLPVKLTGLASGNYQVQIQPKGEKPQQKSLIKL